MWFASVYNDRPLWRLCCRNLYQYCNDLNTTFSVRILAAIAAVKEWIKMTTKADFLRKWHVWYKRNAFIKMYSFTRGRQRLDVTFELAAFTKLHKALLSVTYSLAFWFALCWTTSKLRRSLLFFCFSFFATQVPVHRYDIHKNERGVVRATSCALTVQFLSISIHAC